jgi:hypothetical protein
MKKTRRVETKNGYVITIQTSEQTAGRRQSWITKLCILMPYDDLPAANLSS